jgi:hypothetical protein
MIKKKKGYRSGGKIKGMMMGGRMKAKGMKNGGKMKSKMMTKGGKKPTMTLAQVRSAAKMKGFKLVKA